MPTAYSYLRFSTSEQAKGDSIRRQVEKTADWCARNAVDLDASMSLRDMGVSAFKGRHRENPDTHALAAFVQAVKSGRVPAGSYLVVESLDRLSREKIRPALTLLLNLIEAGIKVVQLIPVEVVYDEDVDPMQLMMAVMELNRGHSESKVKSERIGAVWQRKQREAAERKLVSTKLPCWLKMDGERVMIDPTAGKVVKRIVGMAADHGITAIAKTLNDEGGPDAGT
jgi:DNA invertase Pin-like site-specific DNA recombinase